jgi:endonuclease/exonuclease/phosphatase family metal-dependent hydrolase
MRLATFNAENLFDRPKVMNLPKWSDGQPVLNDYKELTTLMQRGTYSAADKARMKTLIAKYKLHDRQAKHEFMQLRDNRPRLLQSHRDGSFDIVANGRGEWVGWVELTTDSVTDVELQNTGRVIAEVNADILVVVEVDNRIALTRFNNQVVTAQLAQKGLRPYAHNMLIDGNDERGIDVGILSRFPITSMRSHIDERLPGGTKPVFARDCPEYYLDVENGKTFVLLANHFSSQGGGKAAAAWRGQQAARVRDLYQGLVGTFPNIAVLGDLNAPPAEKPKVSLAPLLGNTNLQDVMTLPQYPDTTLPGTFHYCNAQDKLDYILLPPALVANVSAVGVERRGIYVAKKWKPFDTVTDATTGASDHGCLWVDLTVV